MSYFHAYLHLPKTEHDMRVAITQFEHRVGMPQAFGCTDGTHVPLKRPVKN